MNKSFVKDANTINSNLIIRLQRAIKDHDRRNRCFQAPDNPGKAFSKSYLLNLADTLGLDQISVVLQAEPIRERGLALVRAGEIQDAELALSDAERHCAEASLSQHAYLAARTFQAAAEAYLAYRRRQYELAISLLEEALESSRVLSDDFGHDMEFRKVHLCRNIIRTQCYIVPANEVVQSTVALIAYILGNADRWPLRDEVPWSTGRSLADGEVLWSIDETIINLALPEVNLGQAGLTEIIQQEINASAQASYSVAKASYEWILAMIAASNGNESEILAHASVFFTEDPGGLSHAKKAIINALDASTHHLKYLR